MVHAFARKEIDDARTQLDDESPEVAAVFVRNALADIKDYQRVRYEPWQTRFAELVDAFRAEVDRTQTVVYHEGTQFERRFDDQDADPDIELLHLILDELDDIMDEMERLRDEFAGKYESRFMSDSEDEQDSLSEDDFDEDNEYTCLRCGHDAIWPDVRVFPVQGLPGNRVICGRCVFKMTTLSEEDLSESEALARAMELEENRSDVRSIR